MEPLKPVSLWKGVVVSNGGERKKETVFAREEKH